MSKVQILPPPTFELSIKKGAWDKRKCLICAAAMLDVQTLVQNQVPFHLLSLSILSTCCVLASNKYSRHKYNQNPNFSHLWKFPNLESSIS